MDTISHSHCGLFARETRVFSAISKLRSDLARLLLISLGLVLLGLPGHAADPAWWAAQGAVTTTHPPNPDAVVNQGQLKQFAVCAVQELNADLAAYGGAGDALNGLWNTWQQDYATHGYASNPASPTYPYNPADFQAVNVGQLKYIASLIYERLQAVGCLGTYPSWIVVNPKTDNALATLGQLKTVFNFSITLDADGSGLPVWWEQKYFNQTGLTGTTLAPNGDGLSLLVNYQQGIDPVDYYNGQLPTVTMISGTPQTGSPGGFAPQPLVVRVVDANGNPLPYAPIRFQPSAGLLQVSSGSSPVATLVMPADNNGLAQVFFQLPNTASATCTITATATSETKSTAPVTFTISSDNGTHTYASPFAPTNFVAQGNPDGSVDYSWVNHTDNQTSVEVDVLGIHGWRAIVTGLPPGTTSYHYSPP